MSLNYKILFVEDHPRTITSKLKQVKKFLEEEGFRPKITLIENDQDIDKYLDDPLLDLIVTDYYIRDGLNGKQLAENIRRSEKMVEIILYSQKEGTDLYKEVGALDGVYISNREGLEDKIKDVIKITIRRTQNVSNMRGIVISEAIDIENQIEDIILAYYDTKEKELAEELLNGDGCNLFGQKISFLNSFLKKMEKEFNTVINSGGPPGNKKAARSLLDELKPLYGIAKKLDEEVCQPRNMLAHVEHIINTNTVYLKSLKSGYKDIKIKSARCKEIRQQLMKHASNLNQIKDFLPKWHEYKKKVQKN